MVYQVCNNWEENKQLRPIAAKLFDIILKIYVDTFRSLRSASVHDITRSVSARRWEGGGYDARPKPRHS